MDAWEIVSAASGAAAAIVAAWAAWQSRSAAREANHAAATLAQIEKDRRHAELTPVLVVSCEENSETGSLSLNVTLAGPPGLGGVGLMVVTIRDDSLERLARSGNEGPSLEEFLDQIWGPLRFVPGFSSLFVRADHDGRAFRCERGLATGASVTCLMEQTSPPPSTNWNAAQWRRNVGAVLLLSFSL